jgi:hypothetical protein
MAPLRRRWDPMHAQARDLLRDGGRKTGDESASLRPSSSVLRQVSRLLTSFVQDIAGVRVLDPACGSGNFLYVALRQLLDLESGDHLRRRCRRGRLLPQRLTGADARDRAERVRILNELINEADKKQASDHPWVSEWLRERTSTLKYSLSWGKMVSLNTFYGFDRPGSGGITPLYDYITDHDLEDIPKDISREDRYIPELANEIFGWLPVKETVKDSCLLVQDIIDETSFALSFLLQSYTTACENHRQAG